MARARFEYRVDPNTHNLHLQWYCPKCDCPIKQTSTVCSGMKIDHIKFKGCGQTVRDVSDLQYAVFQWAAIEQWYEHKYGSFALIDESSYFDWKGWFDAHP